MSSGRVCDSCFACSFGGGDAAALDTKVAVVAIVEIEVGEVGDIGDNVVEEGFEVAEEFERGNVGLLVVGGNGAQELTNLWNSRLSVFN